MRPINVTLVSMSSAIMGCGVAMLAANDAPPATWEFRSMNRAAENQVVEFVRVDPLPAAATDPAPQTQPATGEVLIRNLIRVCTSNGEPLRGVLIEAFQFRGSYEIKLDTCTTDNEGSCVVSVPENANGRVQVTQQFSVPILYRKTTAVENLGPCEATRPAQ